MWIKLCDYDDDDSENVVYDDQDENYGKNVRDENVGIILNKYMFNIHNIFICIIK